MHRLQNNFCIRCIAPLIGEIVRGQFPRGRIIPGEGEVAGREGPTALPALAFLEIEENLGAPGPPGAPGGTMAPGGTGTRGNHESPLHRFS